MRPFAQHYDAVYSDKNYDAEIVVLTELLDRTDMRHAKFLEIGAGTGNHTLRLAPLFAEIVALEIDADFFDVARLKTAACSNVRLLPTRIEHLRETGFDGVAAFFNVLNYIQPETMRTFLTALSARMKPGSYFITDLWNGGAVLNDPPRPEMRLKRVGGTEVSQRITPFLETADNSVRLDYNVTISHGRTTESFSESLRMHLWRLDELAATLNAAGLTKVEFWDRRKFPAPATDASWHVWMRATKQ